MRYRSRRTLDPFRIEAHAMYIEARDSLSKVLDFRIGQQLVQWGVGDQFNPTNTLNANDVEDPLLFGEQQANLMAPLNTRQEAVTGPSLGVPFPYIGPRLSHNPAYLALADVARLPFTDETRRYRVHSERECRRIVSAGSTVVGNVRPIYRRHRWRICNTHSVLGVGFEAKTLGLSYLQRV